MTKTIDIDKIGSATSPLKLGKKVKLITAIDEPRTGDVVVVKALTESVTYGNLELPSGRLAKINRGDVLLGVLGKRRALKGFVGDVPESAKAGDRLHLLNMGGVVGECKGHHSSFSDAIELEVVGAACDEFGIALNIADGALCPATDFSSGVPIVVVAGSCMNSGKTVAAVEIIKQAANAGLNVGIVGGYGVDAILADADFRTAVSSFVFCASDYVGVIGGITVLNDMGIEVDVVAGSVTDSKMGEDFIREQFGLNAGNARRDGEKLFKLIQPALKRELLAA